MPTDPLQRAIQAVLDGRDPDWEALEREIDSSARVKLHALRSVSVISTVQSTAGSDLVTPFTWGALRVTEYVGRGAHGEVYRARDPHLDRDVALKLLHDVDTPGDDLSVAEGRLLARVRHPNVVPVFGAARIDGRAGIWMEFVDGVTLHKQVERRGPLSATEAIRIGIDICQGVAAIHRAGLVHGDVKAQNVIRDGSGRTILTDFGAGFDRETSDAGVEGTPAYLAPELWAGDPPHVGSDVYAIGVLLFYVVSGRYPRTGPSLEELRQQHQSLGIGTVGGLGRATVALGAVVERALAPAPADRFQSADDFAAALEQLLPGRRRWVFPAAVMAISASAVALVLMLNTTRPTPTLSRAQHVTVEPGLEIDPTLSADAHRVAYAAGIPGHMRVFIKPLPDGAPHRATSVTAGDERRPRWSPDGSRLLLTNGSDIFVTREGDDHLLQITHATSIRAAEWTPDGKRILFVADDAVFAVPSAGGTPVRLRPIDSGAYALAISPGGSQIAWAVGNPDFADGTTQFGNIAASAVYVGSIGGHDAAKVTDRDHLNTGPVWLDDHVVMFVSNRDGPRDVYAQRVDARGSSTPVRMTTGLDVLTVALSKEGTLLSYVTFQRKANAAYASLPEDGHVLTSADLVPLTAANQTIEEMAPSSDGQWLYYCSDVSGYSNLFRLRLPAGPVQRLTSADEDQFINDVSPDGREIVFHTLHGGVREIKVMPAGGGTAQLVVRGLGAEWSPDGRRLLFAEGPFDAGVPLTGSHGLVQRRPDGGWGPAQLMRDHGCLDAQWLSDGARWVSACDREIRVMTLTGETLQTVYRSSRSADPVPVSVRASDNDTVYFKSYDPAGGLASIWRIPIAGGRPTLVLRLDDPGRPSNRTSFKESHGRLYLAIDTYESDVWVASLDAGAVR